MSVFDRVLFVGAHTDDIELFAGGLLNRLLREDKVVNCLTFSSHRGITDAPLAAREHHKNMACLGQQYVLHDLAACQGEFQARRQFVFDEIALSCELDPTLIVTHQRGDTNQDHVTVTEEVLRVAKGRCSVWGGEYPFNGIGLAQPDMFARLQATDLVFKTQSIAAYKSQQAGYRQYFSEAVWHGLAAMRGAQVGAPYAEAFTNMRTVL